MEETAQQKNIFLRFSLLVLATTIIGALFSLPPGFSQSPQLAGARDAKARDEEVREQMIVISRQLGVNCLTCHETDNFASNKKREFRVSKDHMRIVQVLIDNGFNGQNGQPKADCYMCHLGQLKPNYIEPHDPVLLGKPKKSKSEN